MLKKPFSEVTKTRIWKGTGLASVLSILVVTAYAFNITWNAPVSLIVDNIDLKVYSDWGCTTPVTAIDFGQIYTKGSAYYFDLYIRNEGIGIVNVRWNSTLHTVTNQITDNWEFYPGGLPINGTGISHNEVLTTRYCVYVPSPVDPGSYSWTLYLGADP